MSRSKTGSGGSGAVGGRASFSAVGQSGGGRQNVAANTAISLTFSAPVSLQPGRADAHPAIAGKWVQTNATTLTYALDSPLIPSAQMVVTIPGGTHGLRSTGGATLGGSHTVAFGVAAGDTLRLQQLLAQLNYLPVGFSPSGAAPAQADLAAGPAGHLLVALARPAHRTDLAVDPGHDEPDHQGGHRGLRDPEQHRGGRDGGPTVWTAFSTTSSTTRPTPRRTSTSWSTRSCPEPHALEQRRGPVRRIPVNSGAPGADTTDGTYAVFEHVRFSDMKGTNVDGSTYDDPNVPYASYFNGGDALHGFIRASYGTPQSNGCVEMSYANAALVWPLTPIGTLVTVEGPTSGRRHPHDHHDDHRAGDNHHDRSRRRRPAADHDHARLPRAAGRCHGAGERGEPDRSSVLGQPFGGRRPGLVEVDALAAARGRRSGPRPRRRSATS